MPYKQVNIRLSKEIADKYEDIGRIFGMRGNHIMRIAIHAFLIERETYLKKSDSPKKSNGLREDYTAYKRK